MKMMPELRIHA